MNFFINKLVHYSWDLAYFEYKDELIEWGNTDFYFIKNPYKSKWFADPFILFDYDEELQLLVEEFDNNIGRGRIARLVIDKNKMLITQCTIILDLPTHLSFPVIYRRNGLIYVHPENSASGASYMYRYDKEYDKLVDPVCVIEEPITDAIIREEQGMFYMFSTCMPIPNGDIQKIYVSYNFFGPYTIHCEEIFKGSTARMAGNFLNINGKIIRPAQDCNGSYGKAVVFYDGHMILKQLNPDGLKYCGIHTFNTLNGAGIIDLKKWDYPLFVYLKNYVKKLISNK